MWHWRSSTDFRLLELLVAGKADQVAAVLDQRAALGLTMVRVLGSCWTSVSGPFNLNWQDGIRVAPTLCDMARARGLYVEITVFGATAAPEFKGTDYAAVLQAYDDATYLHDNVVIEGANEPDHGSQDDAIIPVIQSWRPRTPGRLYCPGAEHGSDDWRTDRFCGGHFVNRHGDRKNAEDGWREIRHKKDFEADSGKLDLPFHDDEPGRSHQDPAKWSILGVMHRAMPLGICYHSGAGIHSELFTGIELQCAQAFIDGCRIVDDAASYDHKDTGHSNSIVGFYGLAPWEDSRSGWPQDPNNYASRVFAAVGTGGPSLLYTIGEKGNCPFGLQHGWKIDQQLADWPSTSAGYHCRVWTITT